MKHALIDTPQGKKLVRADGTEPRAFDTDRPVLHVLPTLLRPSARFAFEPAEVTCKVEIDGFPESPRIVIRQPVPNKRYYIGCTEDSRWGFLLPLPDPVPKVVTVRLTWSLPSSKTIRHEIALDLEPTDRGQVFSMDTMAHYWIRSEGDPPPIHTNPWSTWIFGELPENRQSAWVSELDEHNFVDVRLSERLRIPGGLLSDIAAFNEFEEEQLHELRRTASFDPDSPNSVAHRGNACIEMPAVLLLQAIHDAQETPFDKGTVYWTSPSGCEQHPAIRRVCDWWNANAPNPEHRQAGLFEISARVEEDGDYWCAYCETPNSEVAHESRRPYRAARVGDVILVDMLRPIGETNWTEHGVEILDVTGAYHSEARVVKEDWLENRYDEAWYTLHGLSQFPHRFPEAYQWLQATAHR